MRHLPYPENISSKIIDSRVGVAGLGGMGSHVANALVRSGIRHITIADFDKVDESNLFRQCYTSSDVGRPKTFATAERLLEIDPDLDLRVFDGRLDEDNVCGVFDGCDVICECFDNPESKAMLVETVLTGTADPIIVSCSGMAGFGSSNSIVTERRMSRLYVCGDMTSDVADSPGLTAARVMVCAGHVANQTLRAIIGHDKP